MSHRSPVTRGRQLHCPLRGSQVVCREPSEEQWQAGERWVWARRGDGRGRGLERIRVDAGTWAHGRTGGGRAGVQRGCPCHPQEHSRVQWGKPWKPGLHSWQAVPA